MMRVGQSELDKTVEASADSYGSIVIRVVVLQKGSRVQTTTELPVDAEPDEALPESDKRPTATFLEEPKRGWQVCVFLINGQRQHAWDNQFIVRDLELKYLRKRLLVIIDCDGLHPEAIADLMQGSRAHFYEGKVYAALESRVIAALKGDPDLRRLEEEAEDDISNLEAGDEAVKAALDQLIASHHDTAPHAGFGESEPGDASASTFASGNTPQHSIVVVEGDPSIGTSGSEPIVQLRPDLSTIRLKPKEARKFSVVSKPDVAWKSLEGLVVALDPPIPELHIRRRSQLLGEELTLLFDEPTNFDPDEYPLETYLRATASFANLQESRLIERRIVVNRKRNGLPPPPPAPLKADPTFLKVVSRGPIRLFVGGADLHVKLKWDGVDELTSGFPPAWLFRVRSDSPTVEPNTFITKPVDGRFEVLIQASSGLTPGERITFEVEAQGPGKILCTTFEVEIAEPPSPRKMISTIAGGAQRRPPYSLVYIKKENWAEDDSNFGEPWTAEDPGAYNPADAKSPLTIFINVDLELLATYRESLLAKRNAESTIQQKINRYTAHIAFHLYQMSEKERQLLNQGNDEMPSEAVLREEIRRVARTLIRLMEIA